MVSGRRTDTVHRDAFRGSCGLVVAFASRPSPHPAGAPVEALECAAGGVIEALESLRGGGQPGKQGE